ncbi:MAG TPA: FecR domain-containing protein [Steroidobacteraceae bacterium]|nr:FecR domain-containing protein [Steroidobacteraceae bacterium]
MKVQKQIDHLLAQRAAEWIDILKAGRETDRAAFVEWLRESKLHVAWFLEMVAIDHELRRLDGIRREDIDKWLQQVPNNVVDLRGAAPSQDVASRVRRQLRWAAAAVVAGIALTAGIANWWLVASTQGHEYTTAIGEQRALALDDGSVVTMNVGSSIAVNFSGGTRHVTLKRGEAFFKVAHDVNRPFIVATRGASVRAVGTAFDVNQDDAGTVVSVLEGRVQVTSTGSAVARTEQSLGAGEQARVATDGRLSRVAGANIDRALAWRHRTAVFDNTLIEDVARTINRYNPSIKIRIEGIAPGTRRYGGIFDVDDPESLADVLAREPDLEVTHHAGEIVIRKRD